MEENVEELIREVVEGAGVVAEVDEGIERELVSLAGNPQPFPPTLVVEAPEVQVQEFHARISLVQGDRLGKGGGEESSRCGSQCCCRAQSW